MTIDPRHKVTICSTAGRTGRAMLKAVGFTDADLERPFDRRRQHLIEVMPCNFHLRRLSERVKAGIRAAGGTRLNTTPSRSRRYFHGHRGHEGVAHQSRGDCRFHRTRCAGHLFDGVVALSGCDKTIPRHRHGALPVECPVAHAIRRLHHAGPVPGT